MRNIFLLIFLTISSIGASAQWTNYEGNDSIAGRYKLAYTVTKNGAFMKLYQNRIDSNRLLVGFLISTNYICVSDPSIDISLKQS
jgi:hypothetical protein